MATILSPGSCFTIGLTTRGRIPASPTVTGAVVLLTWGHLCVIIQEDTDGTVRFIVGTQQETCDLIYNKVSPPVFGSSSMAVISPKVTLLVGILTKPDDPALTSSGTRLPALFDIRKC